MVGVAMFSVLTWLHGYAVARSRSTSQLLRESQAYVAGRRDERADQQNEAL